MACNCRKSKTRRVTRLIPAQPPQVVMVAGVQIDSECVEVDLPDGDGDGDKMDSPNRREAKLFHVPFVEAAIARARGLVLAAPSADTENSAPRPTKVCLNSVTITLLQGTTAGLKITQVQLADDTFATNIAVGASQVISETCEPADCSEKKASATIQDAAGNLVAVLAGFPVCRCSG